MVRLCKNETAIFYREKITLTKIEKFFSVNPECIMAIYSENAELVGCIRRDDFQQRQFASVDELLNNICVEKVVLNDTLFRKAKHILNNHSGAFVPVVDIGDRIVCYCFEQGDFRYDQLMGFLHALIEKNYSVNILDYIQDDPDVIYIYGLNEIAFLLYQVLKRNNSNYILVGKIWEYVCDKSDFARIREQDVLDKNTCKIFAEEGGKIVRISRINENIPNVGENFRVIINAAINLGKQCLEKTLSQLSEDINMCFCGIPVQMPFWTEWSRDFCAIENVHNKIQGYERYANEVEVKKVEAIYGMSKIPVEQKNSEEVIVNIEEGFVGKTYLKERKKNRLYIIGPCIVSGYCVPDYQTISSRLQNYVMEEDYEVIRIPVSKVNWFLMENLKRLRINSRDILLFISEKDSFPEIKNKSVFKLQTDECYAEMTSKEPLFSDCPIHLNGKGHAVLADYVYENYLKREIDCNKQKTEYCIQNEKKVLDENAIKEINNYIITYSNQDVLEAGAIVMNCNPFTLGHQYLIEYAAQRVKYLYIFVVQEDKSFFSFEDRYKMVKLGTKHLKNVNVLPSGKFILSWKTFPSYFEKEEKRETKIDASNDLELFAQYIAPGFNIRYRFAGEETLDKVTRQYNEQMNQMLPNYGIKFVEVPRIKESGGVISASRVRAAIKNNEMDLIKALVSESTWKYLKNNMIQKK